MKGGKRTGSQAGETAISPLSRCTGRRALYAAGVLTLLPALLAACTHRERKIPPDAELADVLLLPQRLDGYAADAADSLPIPPPCRAQLLEEFRREYFRPWSGGPSPFDIAQTKGGMIAVARGKWYGQNRRRVDSAFLRTLLESCALESFPSRNDPAIAVLPSHLRGLPTTLPLFEKFGDFPFDQLEYPQMKLNEPLRVLHATTDGLWLFVETPYSCGWVDARAVALVDRGVMKRWLDGELLVLVRDFQKVSDGRGGGFRAKIGTLLPLCGVREGDWEVAVASADDSRSAVIREVRLPREGALPFPVSFDARTIPLLGNQLAGGAYGWGEMYGLRDCSALLRDLFMPFGIWLPRTSRDQIESMPQIDLSKLSPQEKERRLKESGIPFRTLLFKPGHVMLYIGCDRSGRPLVFHNAWSIRLESDRKPQVHYVGKTVVTTLQPGKEIGAAKGSTLLDRVTALGIITGRCRDAMHLP
ncbi:SH3 domain-containing protein [Geomonas sp. RF6]|uniref:NlpC/P60 family N-terminal domain-containing protein n=1 Tax=Geomonas sp. RF6 TaxID=2897342 RepID=UPI001E5B1D8F|nr:NlpC/P60 family N-terminal domain-containing protein [Geomonas sp. RF6]UFS70916.1 SH3 domain-containing protein [Geomonas sp. RF6]